jgi:hypothetical protein
MRAEPVPCVASEAPTTARNTGSVHPSEAIPYPIPNTNIVFGCFVWPGVTGFEIVIEIFRPSSVAIPKINRATPSAMPAKGISLTIFVAP